MQQTIMDALSTLKTNEVIKNRNKFNEMLKIAFRSAGIKVPATLFKAILMALAERDKTATSTPTQRATMNPIQNCVTIRMCLSRRMCRHTFREKYCRMC